MITSPPGGVAPWGVLTVRTCMLNRPAAATFLAKDTIQTPIPELVVFEGTPDRVPYSNKCIFAAPALISKPGRDTFSQCEILHSGKQYCIHPMILVALIPLAMFGSESFPEGSVERWWK